MQKSFINIQYGFAKLFPGIWSFIKGFFHLLFWESVIDFWEVLQDRWRAANDYADKTAVIATSLVIVTFLCYGFYGLLRDFHDWKTREQREIVLISKSQQEIENFFRKYNQEFVAHNCDFMATVGADESMHDKWGHDKYDKYKCEEFVQYQKKIMIPVSIQPIEKNGSKLRAKGEAIVITQNQGEPWGIKAMYFDLWKVNTWDLWHFNNPKSGPRIIDSVISNY